MKTLLKIEQHDDLCACSSEVHVEGDEELFALCSSLYSVIMGNPRLCIGFETILDMAKSSPEIHKKLVDDVVEAPDFNSILKDK